MHDLKLVVLVISFYHLLV